MVAIESDAAPTTLSGIAAALDDCRDAILSIQAERDDTVADLREKITECERSTAERIAGHQTAAKALFALRQAMERDAFPDLVTIEESKAPGRRRSASGSGGVDYGARIEKRKRTLAAKKRREQMEAFARQRGYEVPAEGEDFPEDVQRAFEQDGGFQG